MCKNSFITTRPTLLLLTICAIFSIGKLNADTDIPSKDNKSEINKLDNQFIHISKQVYDYYAKQQPNLLKQKNNIDKLHKLINKLIKKGETVSAISQIKINIELVKSNTNHQSIIDFTSILLEHNQLQTANMLLTEAKSYSDTYYLSNIKYHFSKYYFSRNNFDKSIALLDGIMQDLSHENYNHALIMHGLALQKSKKHRKAMQLYQQIKPDSKFYHFAKINIAIAELRQGWWTDAHIKIMEILKDDKYTGNAELINRLHVLSGYLLMANEYYRDSRESFRNVEQSSQYANRALLGISITAANQSDYVSSLNALLKLQHQNSTDLSTDESYLLLPYIYEKLNQLMTATASYNAAISYYQKRLQDISRIKNNHANWPIEKIISSNENYFLIGDFSDTLEQQTTKALLYNIKQINRFKHDIQENTLQAKISQLDAHYQTFFKKAVLNLLNERTKHLNNYLSQTRYALAKLYDNTNIE